MTTTHHPKTIAVDFDGVVHGYSKGWQDGTIYDPALPGAIDALHTLMASYAVFIHTSRTPTDVAAWLADYGFDTLVDVDGPKHPKREFWNEQGTLLVTDRKLPALVYIDDRAIRFQSWKQALAKLENLANPPEHAAPTYEDLLVSMERLRALIGSDPDATDENVDGWSQAMQAVEAVLDGKERG